MSYSNRMRRTLAKLDGVPAVLRARLSNLAIGRTIPFVGTAGLSMEALSEQQVRISLKNARKVQNHIGGVHAAASALLAETATGLVVGMNVQDACIPLMKRMRINFVKRSEGDLLAVATLTQGEVQRLQTTDKGDLSVAVRVVDESGQETIECEMIWAWVPKPATSASS